MSDDGSNYDEDEGDYLDEEEGEEEEDDSHVEVTPPSALPRPMSQLNIPDQKEPMPEASALFVFSHTNR